MSKRDQILSDYVTLLNNISTANGYENDVAKVAHHMLYWDQEESFPVLMVLGGGEDFEDTLGGEIYSTLHILVRGYSQDVSDPSGALNSLIADVLRVVESDDNVWRSEQKVVSLETDEGWFNFQAQGFGYFNLELTVMYGFERGNP